VVFGIARGFRLGGAAVFTHWGIRLILARQKERPGQHLGFGQEQEQHPVITRGRTDLIRRSFFTQASESSLSFCHA
jgi:hypothetical protein